MLFSSFSVEDGTCFSFFDKVEFLFAALSETVMIDIHCHILPYSDDGSESLAESLAMARAAAASGVDTVVMTPHCNLPDAESDNFLSAELEARYKELQNEVRVAGIPLTLLPGAEVFYTPEVPSFLKRGLLPHLNHSDYLLVEFYFDSSPEDIRAGLESILSEGLKPILAHPERYHAVQAEPYLVGDWFESGSIIQINKGSLLGRLGRGSFRAADWILGHGLAHVVASDAHTSTVRTPDLESVSDLIAERFSPDYAELLLETNPRHIIENHPIIRAD